MGGRGRGRGRGRGMSFDISALGMTAGEPLPAPILQPPPTYPPLDRQPAPMQSSPEMEYMIALKKDFVVFFNNFLRIPDKGGKIKENAGSIDWRFLPAELMPKKKTAVKRSGTTTVTVAKKSNINLALLDELEKLESNVNEPEVEQEAETEEKQEEGQNEEEEEEEEEDLDEEMDDGTDYVNNYFDNGEGFDDDDDNGNDGPIY